MRCILINGAQLKANTFCAHCGSKIRDSYVREIGSKLIFCDYQCYSMATDSAAANRASLEPVASIGSTGTHRP